MRFPLGQTEARATVEMDLERLIDTRLLIQANSGAGKSWAIRRLLEQTHGQVQHIVIDPEGEFGTLRERFDYVHAGHGGDCAAEPRSAHLLARKLLELGVSAILDIYELKQHERVAFVRRFLEALVNAPKRLWHPVLVVVDEAHVFCPEKGKAESAGAVIDLATRGRKRGMCAVLATQRLSKLNKDAAAELNNVLIGRTGLDIDMARASDALGLATREDRQALRFLLPGMFYAFGPALPDGITRVMIGDVTTTHPKVGARLALEVPPPTAKVRALLAELADLPEAAAKETRDLESYRREVASLKGKLRHAEKTGGVDEHELERHVREAVSPLEAEAQRLGLALLDWQRRWDDLRPLVGGVTDSAGQLSGALDVLIDVDIPTNNRSVEPQPTRRAGKSHEALRLARLLTDGGEPHLRKGARRILDELARRHPLRWSRAQVATLTGYSPRGGTFNTYLGDLRRAGYLDEDDVGLTVSAEGLDLAGVVEAVPTTPHEALNMWCGKLRSGAGRMLIAVVDAGDFGISRSDLAATAGYAMTGGTFSTYLGDLRRNGLTVERNGLLVATDILRGEVLA